jgi:hypothetical protein
LKESAYNLFLYVEKTQIKDLGVAVHELDGTDAEKLAVLQSRVAKDCGSAKRYRLDVPLEWSEYQGSMRLGRQLELFEGAFQDCQAPAEPLCVITPIVDGMPRVLAGTNLGPLNLDDLKNTPLAGPGTMIDYFKEYVQDGGFDLPRLINDDYFKAIRLLYNAGLYVSCAKLLMSFIDTVAFVDLGDVSRNFIRWLELYAGLASLGVTAQELWEFRNGLLHMTNLNSRSVVKGSTARLIMFVGNLPQGFSGSSGGEKYFNLKGLIDVIAEAVGKWASTYNADRDKFVEFVARYDLTVSDSRMGIVSY